LWTVSEGDGGTLLVGNDSALSASGLDVDDSARHVEFTISSLVHPGPRENDIISLGGIGWDAEVEGAATRSRAIADEGLDDGEGISLVVGEGQLARSAVVERATLDGHRRLLTGRVRCDSSTFRGA
jgi:hypothetical protein